MSRIAVAALLLSTAGLVHAQAPPEVRRASSPEVEAWAFALTAYPTHPRGGDTTTSAIGAADRGALHLEARYGYEEKDARSAFLGWTFSGGETVKWELTPIVGIGWGPTRSFIPGFEASAAWGRFDAYVEGEFVMPKGDASSRYHYAWSELGFKATEALRIGAVGQRTRLYGGEREFQRGPFAQLAWKSLTLGAFWFNPGASDQVFVGSVGLSF